MVSGSWLLEAMAPSAPTAADRPFLRFDLDVGPDHYSQPSISGDGMRIVFRFKRGSSHRGASIRQRSLESPAPKAPAFRSFHPTVSGSRSSLPGSSRRSPLRAAM